MYKIRTLIAHDDIQIVNNIKSYMDKLDYVDVLETAHNGIDAYNKIIKLQPEVVFTQFNFDNMEGIELVKKTKEHLKENTPVFNIITKPISQEEITRTYSIIGKKFNVLITNVEEEKIINIMEDYREYINK